MKIILFILFTTLALAQSIFAQDTSDGIVWMSPVQLSPDSDRYAGWSSIAVQGDTIYVTWCWSQFNFPYRRSVDGGRSFEPLRTIPTPESLAHTSVCFFVSAGKRLHAFFIPQVDSAHPDTRSIYTMYSDDAAESWSPVKTIPHAMILGSVGAYKDTIVIKNFSVGHPIYTTDGGDTWTQASSLIWGASPKITYANGILHLVKGAGYMIPGLPEFVIQYKRSTDLGNTWADSLLLNTDWPGSSDACIASDPEANPGIIISVWKDGKYGCLTEVGCSQVGSWSFDNGKTGQPHRRMDVIPAGYEAFARVKDSTIAVIWNHDIPWAVGPVVVTVSTNRGQSWSTPYYATQDTNKSYHPSPLALSNGTVHLTSDNVTGGNGNWRFRVFYRRGIILSAQRSRFAISSRNLSFEETIVSCRINIPITVRNNGGAALFVQSVLSNDSNFTVAPTSASINPYDSLVFFVTFEPRSQGMKSGVIVFNHNAQGTSDTVTVFGTGTESGLTSVSPGSLSFGETTISCRTTMPITIKNNSCAPLPIQSVVTSDSNFAVTPAAASINPSDSMRFLVTFNPATPGVKSGSIIFNYNVQGFADTVSVTGIGIGSTATAVITISYGTGWQLLSLPVSMLCPYIPRNIFVYSSSYILRDTVDIGTGYWQKLSVPTLRFVGFSVSDNTVQVRAGWNMVGSISIPISISSIVTQPEGIIRSPFFGYNSNGYEISDTIEAGRGYWIKVSQNGQIILQDAFVNIAKQSALDLISESNILTITDSAGRSQKLYFTSKPCEGSKPSQGWKYELPPPPPEGIFDVRYASGRMLEVIGNGTEYPIEISSAEYPVTISWSIKSQNITASLIIDDKEIPLRTNGSTNIEHRTSHIALRFTGSQNLPSEFALAQNYPNPFNPITRFEYSLPEDAYVTLRIYNVVGQEVATLIDEFQGAGYKSVEFDGSSLTSGIYFYRLQAGTFTDIKKMVIIK